MLIQDIINIISCSLFITQPLRTYSSYERQFIDIYSLSFFALDTILFNTNPELLLHHIFISSALLIDIISPFPLHVYYTACNTEWSTICLTLMPYISNSIGKQICQSVFVLLFFKFRIYDLYYLFQTISMDYIHTFPILCLYTLNLYWWVLICKKMCKPLKHKVYVILNQHIVSYPMLINYCILAYRMFPNYWYLQLTSFVSGITSYLYHKEIAYVYNGIPSINSMWIMLDITAFHLFQVEYIRHGYNEIFYISCIIHFINVMYIYIYKPINVSNYSMLAILVDKLYILYYYPSIELFTIILLLLYIHVLNPAYDLSFVVTHGVLSWNVYACTTRILSLN
jgi:hypothetical protein